MPKLPHKFTQFLTAFFKVVVVICVCIFIYKRLLDETEFKIENWLQFLINSKIFTLKVMIVLVSFTLLNWFLELKKWKRLVYPFSKITLKDAFKQCLSAHVLAIITPFRAGEYGVKAVYFPKFMRSAIIKQNGLGHFMQLAVTGFFGVIGCISIALSQYPDKAILIIFGVTLLIASIILIVRKLINRFKLDVILITQVLKLSILRYLVFAHQFYFILLIFNIQIGYVLGMSVISATYLIASVIPILNLFDAALKGSIAITLFSLFGVSAMPIFCATLLMWMLNFVFPAGVGSIYFLKLKTHDKLTIKLVQDV